MEKQNGFSSLILLFILTSIGAAFYLGMNTDKLAVLNSLNTKTVVKQEKNSTPAASTQENNRKEAYSGTSDETAVNFKGQYFIGDFDKLIWKLTLPKKGGPVTGTVEGACVGQIIGNFATPDEDGEGKVVGSLEGECQPVPRFSFKTKVKSTFEGMVHLKPGVINIIHDTTEPYPWRGSFDLNFTP